MSLVTINPYQSALDGNVLYQSRNTIKVGGSGNSIYRSVMIFDLTDKINNEIVSSANYETGSQYSILNCTLTLTSSDGKSQGNLYAMMLPLSASTDESVSWYKPTEASGTTWSDGGGVEPLAKEIIQQGTWNGNQISFDITPFACIWQANNKPTFEIILTSDETNDEVWQFYSQQATTPVISGAPLTNVKFLGAGDTNTMNTEGIVVQISPQLPYLTIQSSDTSANGNNRWAAFNASVSVGDTFSMFLPDTNVTQSVYTLLDKRTTPSGETQFLVSGSVSGFETTKHATAEFSCTGRVESGTGIVEFASPNNSLKVDLAVLQSENTVFFDYKPTITPNNAKSFTVDFVMDETLKNNRSRLYLKEQTTSENRNGLSTTVRKTGIRPKLSLSLLV